MAMQNIKDAKDTGNEVVKLLRNGEQQKAIELLEQRFGQPLAGLLKAKIERGDFNLEAFANEVRKIEDAIRKMAKNAKKHHMEEIKASEEEQAAKNEQAKKLAAIEAEAKENENKLNQALDDMESLIKKGKGLEERLKIEKKEKEEKEKEVKMKNKQLEEEKKKKEKEAKQYDEEEKKANEKAKKEKDPKKIAEHKRRAEWAKKEGIKVRGHINELNTNIAINKAEVKAIEDKIKKTKEEIEANNQEKEAKRKTIKALRKRQEENKKKQLQQENKKEKNTNQDENQNQNKSQVLGVNTNEGR